MENCKFSALHINICVSNSCTTLANMRLTLLGYVIMHLKKFGMKLMGMNAQQIFLMSLKEQKIAEY